MVQAQLVDERRMRMIRSVVLLVVFVLSLPTVDGTALPARTAPQLVLFSAVQEALVDLAWLVPIPADLEVPGYGVQYGTYRTDATRPENVFGDPEVPGRYGEALSASGT